MIITERKLSTKSNLGLGAFCGMKAVAATVEVVSVGISSFITRQEGATEQSKCAAWFPLAVNG
jgi:hypothetical protein